MEEHLERRAFKEHQPADEQPHRFGAHEEFEHMGAKLGNMEVRSQATDGCLEQRTSGVLRKTEVTASERGNKSERGVGKLRARNWKPK